MKKLEPIILKEKSVKKPPEVTEFFSYIKDRYKISASYNDMLSPYRQLSKNYVINQNFDITNRELILELAEKILVDDNTKARIRHEYYKKQGEAFENIKIDRIDTMIQKFNHHDYNKKLIISDYFFNVTLMESIINCDSPEYTKSISPYILIDSKTPYAIINGKRYYDYQDIMEQIFWLKASI